MKPVRTRNIILLCFILAKFVIHFFAINPVYELQRDEYLHLDLGNHLAFGYTSVPPLTGLVSFIIQLLGNGVFWVKFFPALFGALIILVIWKTIEELEGGLFALILGSLGILFSVFVRINILYQPNSLDYLFWTLFLYYAVRYFKSGNSKWIYFALVSFALGLLNKYNIGFLMLGFIPAVLLTKNRKIVLDRHLYMAALVAFIIVLPNIIWQFRHGLPVIGHMRMLADTQLVNVKRTDFLVEQLYFFTGSILVLFLGLLSFFLHRPFRKYRVLFYTFIFTLAIFTWLRAKNYYSIGLYPVFIAFGAVYSERLLARSWYRYLRIVLLASPVITFIVIAPLLLPLWSPEKIMEKKELFDKLNLTRWEDGQTHLIPQDFADMLGWKELAEIVDSALVLIGDKGSTLVHCENYGEAGAINYYSNELGKAEALSLNADYIYWYPLDEVEIKHVILVREPGDEDPDRTEEEPYFEKITEFGEITNPYAREKGTKVYILWNAKVSINQILEAEINERLHDE